MLPKHGLLRFFYISYITVTTGTISNPFHSEVRFLRFFSPLAALLSVRVSCSVLYTITLHIQRLLTYLCSVCGEPKPFGEFSPNSSYKLLMGEKPCTCYTTLLTLFSHLQYIPFSFFPMLLQKQRIFLALTLSFAVTGLN